MIFLTVSCLSIDAKLMRHAAKKTVKTIENKGEFCENFIFSDYQSRPTTIISVKNKQSKTL